MITIPTAILTEEAFKSKMSIEKPKMSSNELVKKMKDKGIVFSEKDELEIEQYFLNSNNFFRLCSYRKNYQKYLNGTNKGKYIDLTFEQLKALAILDMKIRKYVLSISVDVEHSIKLRLLRDFESSQEDGYNIVQKFFSDRYGKKTAENIINKMDNVYLTELTHKYIYLKETDKVYTIKHQNNEYNIDVPVWAMLELMTFGDLLNFYRFFYDELGSKAPIPLSILHKTKNIRNACAHNNCILNNLTNKSANIPADIGKYARGLGLSPNAIKSKLKCTPLCEIMCALYCLDLLGTEPVKKHDFEDIAQSLNKYCTKYLSLFDKNELIKTSIIFLKKTIDNLVAI